MTDAQIVIVVATLLVGFLALYVAFRLLRGLYRLLTGKKPARKIPVARLPRRMRYDYDSVPGVDEDFPEPHGPVRENVFTVLNLYRKSIYNDHWYDFF